MRAPALRRPRLGFRGGWAPSLLLVLGWVACRPAPVLVPLTGEEGTVVILGWDGPLPVGQVAGPGPWPAVDLGPDTPGLVLSYPLTPVALGLPLGPLVLDPRGVNLPAPAEAWALVDGTVRVASADELDRLKPHRFRRSEVTCDACGQVLAGQLECLDCRAFAPPAPPEAPEPPRLPKLSPCPSGWAPEEGPGGESFCRPPAPRSCPPGEIPVGVTCAPLAPCPVGRFAVVPPGAVHVDPEAPPGGDGREASPLPTIAAALAVAPAGATLALSAGRHVGPVRLSADVALVGLCPGQTVITGAVVVDAGRARVEGLSLEAGLFTAADTDVEGRRLVFRRIGVLLRGRGVLAELSFEAPTGPGIRAESGAELVADQVFVADAAAAISAAAAAIQVRRLTVEGGGGLFFQGSRVALEQSWVRGTVGPGLEASQGAEVRGVDLAFLDCGGAGLNLVESTLSLGRVLVSDAAGPGIAIGGGRSTISDLIVLRPGGRGIDLVTGTASVSRVLVTNPQDFVNFNASLPVDLADLTVRSAGGALEGAVFYGSGPFEVRRLAVDGAHKIGVVLAAGGTFTDLTVRGIVAISDQEQAKGVALRDAQATVFRASIAEVQGIGLSVGAPGDPQPRGPVLLDDLAVKDCQEGLSLHGDQPIFVRRALVQNTPYEGVQLGNGVPAGVVQISDLEIQGAGRRPEVNAALLLDQVQATLERVHVRGAGRGLLLRPLAVLTALEVRIEGNQVGATVSTGGQSDLPGVVFLDNEIPLTTE